MAVINLRSDTQTLPSTPMRAAIAAAEVGDEHSDSDPTVMRLCHAVADLTNREAAIFVPSGTMANLIAAATWTRRGDSVIVGGTSHSVESEAGSFAAVAGVLPIPVGGDGRFDADELRPLLEPGNRVRPSPSLVVMEQTVNFGGGIVWDQASWTSVISCAASAAVPVHVDGARIFNAAAATGVEVDAWTDDTDSVYLDFTKGLGAPFGSVLAGSAEFIEEAWSWKHRLGGAMRQAGMMAAGCLYALEHNVARLTDDHDRAARLHACLAELGCVGPAPETNMVWFKPPHDGPSVDDTVAALDDAGIAVGVLKGQIRAVTHLDIDDAALDETMTALRKVLG